MSACSKPSRLMCNLLAHASARTIRLISWSCFSVTLSAGNGLSPPFMNVFPPLQTSSWHSLVAIVCLIVPPSLVFSPPLIRPRWKHCVPSFKRTWWREPLSPLSVVCGIDAPSRMSSWMSTAPDRLPANVRSPNSPRFPHPIGVSPRLRLRVTKDAKCGEVVRTRTTILQTHTHQFMGTFGGSGNGDYRGELKRALQVITSYAGAHQLLRSQIVVRLDGLYGDAAVLRAVLDPALGLIGRSRDYALLDLPVVQAVLACPPAQVCTHPESGALRSLYDCPEVPLGAGGPCARLIVASHPATSTSVSIGKKRDGMVYELFITRLASPAFSAKDVLDLYLHRGSFETVLADEDIEQDSDRWCSHTPCGQEFWQIISQW